MNDLRSSDTTTVAEARSFSAASRSLLRDSVLLATGELLSSGPWRSVTVAQVAKAAGVSRQTVYNEFGNREELARAYVAWAGDQMLDEVERCVADNANDLVGALTAAFRVFLEVGAGHPVMRSLGDRTGSDDLVSVLAGDSGAPIVVGATERLSAIVAQTWPELPVDAVEVACEVLVRLAISHLLLPTGDPATAARQVSLLAEPFIASVRDEPRLRDTDVS